MLSDEGNILIKDAIKMPIINGFTISLGNVINEYLIKKGKGFLKNEFITIMGIKLSSDLSIALIFISVLNHDKNEFVEQLLNSKKYDVKNKKNT